jgi:hypothetical protein
MTSDKGSPMISGRMEFTVESKLDEQVFWETKINKSCKQIILKWYDGSLAELYLHSRFVREAVLYLFRILPVLMQGLLDLCLGVERNSWPLLFAAFENAAQVLIENSIFASLYLSSKELLGHLLSDQLTNKYKSAIKSYGLKLKQ